MKKKDETKFTKIQDAVAKIILTEGVASVSTIKVAKIVGIAQSNVYLYFKNKNEMLNSVYQREITNIKTSTDLEQLLNKELPLSDRIDGYLSSIYHYSLAHPDSLTLIEQIKMLNLTQSDFFVSTDDIVGAMMQEGIAAKYLKDLPVSLHMTAIFNIMHQHALNIKNGLYPADRYTEQAITQMASDAIRQ